jgi:2-octaprenyl-6-methoxyphenol hydroxylase
MTVRDTFDIAIVGGGPVGAALALALADSGLAVALLEAKTHFAAKDPRAIALAQGSRLVLERLGAWDRLAPHATSIETIHVSQRGGFGRAELTAAECGVSALGYTVEYGHLYAAIGEGLPDCGADLITGARVTGVHPAAGCGLIDYELGETARSLTARLIVMADGGKSLPGRTALKDYGQSAIVCTVQTARPHGQRAYERFTPAGPIALLPLNRPLPGSPGHPLQPAGEDGYALVWTTPNDQMEERLGLPEAEFLAQLQSAFGDRQGRFLAAGPRSVFPLRLVMAEADDTPGLARIGNAAQTLHPVAGQGFNLGLRDAWKLAQTALDSPREALGSPEFLVAYRASRRWDVTGSVAMTDLLVELFANDLPVISQVRGLALTALDLLPPVRHLFARKMMFGAKAW